MKNQAMREIARVTLLHLSGFTGLNFDSELDTWSQGFKLDIRSVNLAIFAGAALNGLRSGNLVNNTRARTAMSFISEGIKQGQEPEPLLEVGARLLCGGAYEEIKKKIGG